MIDLSRAKAISARVWPHNHVKDMGGPLDVKIGVTSQPDILKTWNTKIKPKFCLEQIEPEVSNLTILQLLFIKPGNEKPGTLVDADMHNANMWKAKSIKCPPPASEMSDDEAAEYEKVWRRMQPTEITVNIKGRYSRSLPHPIPLGAWQGTVVDDEDGKWVLFTLQAVTLSVQKAEQKRTILVPGDVGFESITTYTPLVQ